MNSMLNMIMAYFIESPFVYLLPILRKDQISVGAYGKRGVPGEAVAFSRLGGDVGARMILEILAVTLPVAVKPELPCPCGRKADDIAILRFVEKVGNNDNVVSRSPL